MRKENEQKKMIKQELVQTQDTNREKRTFLANIAHDIRTLIDAILGMINLAKQEELTDKLNEYLECIGVAARRLLGLVNEIIEMEQIESGKFLQSEGQFSMNDLLKNVCQLLQLELTRKGHTLQFSTEGISETNVLGDDRQLEKVLFNVLENAIKYTPNGGKIRFEAYEKKSSVSGEAYFEFLIEDDGIGMDEECLSTIFIPFERGKETKGIPGSGLGMSIVKGIVEQMHGDIQVESSLGLGTQVKIVLPLKKEKCTKLTEQNTSLSLCEIAGAGKKILLVEDNVWNRRIAGELMKSCGAEVTMAESGEHAVEILQEKWERKEWFDLIFMDVLLPGENGYETTRTIRKLELNYAPEPDKKITPIIALTANVSAEDVHQAMAAGMNDYLEKPIDVEKLAGLLTKWLHI